MFTPCVYMHLSFTMLVFIHIICSAGLIICFNDQSNAVYRVFILVDVAIYSTCIYIYHNWIL